LTVLTGREVTTMTTRSATRGYLPAGDDGVLTEQDAEILGFIVEMYGVQVDQLAALLADRGEPADSAADRARAVVARWRAVGYAETAQLTLGEPWIWASRKGLDACGLRPKVVKPATRGLRHTHAVTHVRLAVERTSVYRDGGATWRAERSILAGLGYPARFEHIPDGEVHWPAACRSPWAGEIWAVEIEITRKSVDRVARAMQETLARTSDYGSPQASVAGPGRPARYARLVWVCSPASVRTVLNARAKLGAALSAAIKVYDLPESAVRLNTPKRGWEP
jgi:hypothetical protein